LAGAVTKKHFEMLQECITMHQNRRFLKQKFEELLPAVPCTGVTLPVVGSRQLSFIIAFKRHLKTLPVHSA